MLLFIPHVILNHSLGWSYFLKLMTGKVTVFWNVTPCNLVELHWQLWRNFHLCLQSIMIYVGSRLLRNVSKFLPHYTALVPEDCNFLISNILYSRHPFFFIQQQEKQTFLTCIWIWKPAPVAAKLRRRPIAARLLRLWTRIPPGTWMFVCWPCCVLSGRGLCNELITRPDESYWLSCVVVCDLETSWMGRPWPTVGLSRQKQTNVNLKRVKKWNACCVFAQ
jgi:hypothetical protein